MPVHKKTFKKVKKFVSKLLRKVDPFGKVRRAIEPKKKTKTRFKTAVLGAKRRPTRAPVPRKVRTSKARRRRPTVRSRRSATVRRRLS